MQAAVQPTVAWHTVPSEDAVRQLASDAHRGLSAAEAAARFQRFGPNTLTAREGRSWLAAFGSQFAAVLVWLLVVAAGVSAVLAHEPLVCQVHSVRLGTNLAVMADVYTPGEYTSTKEIRMNTTTQTTKTTALAIDGMTCGHCVQAVTKALSAEPGVKVRSVTVGSAVIEAEDGLATGRAVAALDAAGYPAKATHDAAAASAASPAKSGGGCCGGARSEAAGNAPGATPSGGCCG